MPEGGKFCAKHRQRILRLLHLNHQVLLTGLGIVEQVKLRLAFLQKGQDR